MLDPDATRVPGTHAPPAGLAGPNALQILTTEHWSLLGGRSLVYTESFARASMFIAALSGAVVALALVAQATDFGDGFVAFALVLLPVVLFIGLATFGRLLQVAWEDIVWIQGMNRLRHAYLELEPELAPYFVTSRYDDEAGVLQSALGRTRPVTSLQALLSIAGIVAVLDCVVVGAIAGITALGLDLGTGTAVTLGAVGFLLCLGIMLFVGTRTVGASMAELETRFPTPG